MVFSKTAKAKKNTTKARKIINAIVTSIIVAIFVLALAAMIYLLVQLVKGKAPSLFGYRFYYVLTDSMKPSIEPTDMILSKIIKDNTDVEYVKNMVHEGDVVTYIGKVGQNDEPITHRVIKSELKDDVIYFDEEKDSWMIITKGDNNYSADAPIPITKLDAVMVRKVNIVSKLFNFISTKRGGLVLIAIPIIFILIPFIFRLFTAIRTPQDDKKKKLDDEEKKLLEEEIARKAVEEYIAQNSNTEKNQDNIPTDNKD